MNEAVAVARLAAQHAQAILERRQRADAADERDPGRPGDCGQVKPCEARPAEHGDAAQHDEGDEREMQDEDRIRKNAPGHRVVVTGRFSSLQRW